MTETVKDRIINALEQAKTRNEKVRNKLRRNRLAYIGMHGTALEKVQEGFGKLRTSGENLFDGLAERGEDLEERANDLLKGAKGKIDDVTDNASDAAWKFTPGSKVNRVEELEAELAVAKAKLETLSKKAKTAPKKAAKTALKTTTKAKKTTTKIVKTAANAAKETVKEVKAETKTATPAPKAKTASAAKARKEEPRHIPYFNDVKRYDPLAKEDIVRKIVNHCGIALQSVDARNVACSDEAERNRVRDSWMKNKLGLTAEDAELDKKVQNICAVMQRDNHKNRVTFYYLIAKAERKLGDL